MISKLRPIEREYIINRSRSVNKIKVPEIEGIVKKKFRPILMFCPYCRKETVMWSSALPTFCPFCGNISPINKMREGISKVQKMLDTIKEIEDEELIRILMENAVISLTTGIELFFREIYAITLNERNVLVSSNQFNYYYKQVKNQFMNFGIVRRIYKKELGIKISDLITKDQILLLNKLGAMRNCIIHNNGYADIEFNNQVNGDYRLGKPIPIKTEEVIEILAAVNNLLSRLKSKFKLEAKYNIWTSLQKCLEISKHRSIYEEIYKEKYQNAPPCFVKKFHPMDMF
jgi:hypothetical protein